MFIKVHHLCLIVFAALFVGVFLGMLAMSMCKISSQNDSEDVIG